MHPTVINTSHSLAKNGMVHIDVTISMDAFCPSPRVSVLLSTSDGNNRIIPLPVKNYSNNILTAAGKIDLSHVFFNEQISNKLNVQFLFSDGIELFYLNPNKDFQLTIGKKNPFLHFIKSNPKEKMRIIASLIFSAISLPYRLKPVQKNKVTFLSNRSDYPTGNMSVVIKQLKKDSNLEIIVLCKKGGLKKSLPSFFKFVKHYYTSKVVFVDDYYHFISYVKKKKENNLIQMWHACGAFKTFGFSRLARNDSHLQQSSPNHRQYDHVLVSSKGVIPCYAEGFGVSIEKVIPTGSPRCDILKDKNYCSSFKNSFYKEHPNFKNKKILLFAPTFRGGGHGNCYYPTERFEADKILEALGDEYVIAVKMHPYLSERPYCSQKNSKRILDFSDNYDVNDLLLITDVLITDYSSVIFEASILNIPMLFFAFDLKEYCSERDFYFDYKSFVPGKIVYDTHNIIGAIYNNDLCHDLVKPFSARFFDDTAGKATDNVINFTKELLKKH